MRVCCRLERQFRPGCLIIRETPTPNPSPKFFGGGEYYLWSEFQAYEPEIRSTKQNPPFQLGRGD